MYKNIFHKTKNISETKNLDGFTLLEALIALLIFSVGLLGLAALQANALKLNHGSYYRTQATFLAYDMMDRLRANRTNALEEECNIEMGIAHIGSGLCNTDVNDWQDNFVKNLLPSGQGKIGCDASTGGCSISVQWDETRQGGDEDAVFTITAFL